VFRLPAAAAHGRIATVRPPWYVWPVFGHGENSLIACLKGLRIMPDFCVDYALLEQVENTLNNLKREFSNIDALRHTADWGDGGIESAMGSFASNWSIHREKLMGSLDAMIKNAHECRTQTDQYDTSMAQHLTKK
jgi:hypothetical protein